MRIGAGVLAAAIGLFAALTVIPAQAGDIYTVRGVRVDETAASATEARSIAQVKGQRQALTLLMRRLTLSGDWSRLPQVGDQTAQDAVRGFQVASEKTSSTRYIAELIVSFHPEAVKRLLRGQGISYAETAAKPVVLFPVLQGAAPGNSANPWREAWVSLDTGDAITPVIVADDNSAASVGGDDVIVATASLGADGGLAINVRANGDSTFEPIYRTFQDGQTAEGMKAAASAILDEMEQRWKSATIVRGGAQAQLTTAVFFSSVEQWEAIRHTLSDTPLVQGMQINGITAGSAEVLIDYRGTPDKLAFLLEQKNVALMQEGSGWILRMK